MTEDERTPTDRPGKALRNLYLASLAALLALVGLWIQTLLFPMRFRVVFDQLGMTEPPISTQALDLLAAVINAVSAVAPGVALLLLLYGRPVLKRGSRRTMKRMMLANWTVVVLVLVFTWYLPYAELQRKLGGGA